jgi:hypothetical protein
MRYPLKAREGRVTREMLVVVPDGVWQNYEFPRRGGKHRTFKLAEDGYEWLCGEGWEGG